MPMQKIKQTDMVFFHCRSTSGSISGSVLDAERYIIRSGLAVVINNSEFDRRLRLPDRPGSLENEAEPLEERFKDLGFKTILLTDATKKDMENKFSESKIFFRGI